MADVKFPMTPEQALARFDTEATQSLERVKRFYEEVRRDLEVNANAAKDVSDNMPPLLAKSIAFLTKDFVMNNSLKGIWEVSAGVGGAGYSNPTTVRERTVAEVDLSKGVYRAIFVLYPVG